VNDASKSRVPELDGWRAVSVLLVILHHVGKRRFFYKVEVWMIAGQIVENYRIVRQKPRRKTSRWNSTVFGTDAEANPTRRPEKN
jgi:peptidoglycan/LPS O-acetylase OafA/YrhL